MRALRFAPLVFLSLACAGGVPRSYDNNVPELATADVVKEHCSCLFVLEMPEDFCNDWTRVSPNIVKLKVDTKNKTVRSTALLLWGDGAKYVDEKRGCVLE